MQQPFEPKLVSTLRTGLWRHSLKDDIIAGIIVGIVALPLSIAFAIASGVRPEQGLISAVIGGFLISFFSGSKVQIGGPTGAFIVIIYGIIQKHGVEGLAMATIMAGVLLVLLGLARFGEVIKYIPYPVTVGFTSGIALIIFSTQIKDLLGLYATPIPEHFLDKWHFYLNHLSMLNVSSLFLGLISIIIILGWRRITDKIPGALVAIIVTTAIAQLMHWPVETIGTQFGNVPNTFPAPHIPLFSLERIIALSQPALAIALLAGIESLLSAVVADGMIGSRHRSNMELIAQGIANIVTPIFGGIPTTGAIARTATNIKNGGKSPIAGLTHALTILIIFLFLGQWAKLIPMATLSGILIIVAYNMSEWHLFIKIFKGPKNDVLVLLCTFLLTVLVDLVVAIEVGMVLASFLFMHRMVEVTAIKSMRSNESDDRDADSIPRHEIPAGIEIFEINGPFFFGAADKFRDTLTQFKNPPRILILRMRFVNTIDATGLSALEDVITKSRKKNMDILIAEAHGETLTTMKAAGINNILGEDHIHDDIQQSLNVARNLLQR